MTSKKSTTTSTTKKATTPKGGSSTTSTTTKKASALVEQSLEEMQALTEEYFDMMDRLSGGTANEWKMRQIVGDFMLATATALRGQV